MGECIGNFTGGPYVRTNMAICSTLRSPPLAPVVYSLLRRRTSSICSSVDVVRQAGRISDLASLRVKRGRHSCSCENFPRNGKGVLWSESLWKFESSGRGWPSGLALKSNARTLAGLPLRSSNSDDFESSDVLDGEGEGSENGASVKSFLSEGFLAEAGEKLEESFTKPELCTADELHYVVLPGTEWQLALWRYHPAPNTPKRNHPLLMLSGIGTNALGFDLDPSGSRPRDEWDPELEEISRVSMARAMAGAGFDTWVLETRGSGLSKAGVQLAKETKPPKTSDETVVVNNNESDVPETTDLGKNPRELSSKAETDSNSDSVAEETIEPTVRGPAPMKIDSFGASLVATTNETKDEDKPQSQTSVDSEVGQKRLYDVDARDEKIVNIVNNEGSIQQKSEQDVSSWDTWKTATSLSNAVLKLSDQLSKLISEGQSRVLSARFIDSIVSLAETSGLSKQIGDVKGRLTSLLETRQASGAVTGQFADLRKWFFQLLEDGQGAVSPRVSNLQERLSTTVEDFQKVVDLVAKYNWDFDDYLEEDVPIAMEYIRNKTNPVDGKMLAVGHSMGGIVLYALLSTQGEETGLAGAVALASALDYQCSDTSLKKLLPLTDPAQLLNVPLVPLGGLMNAVHPLITRPPYALSYIGHNVSAPNMMEPELFSKLIQNNFGVVPVKLLLHLISVFRPGGLSNRDGTFFYKDNLGKVTVPVLAVAGDQDLICPPEAVIDTVDLFQKEVVTYQCFGGENDRHYGHYDIVCSPAAAEEVYPVVVDFLVKNDELKVGGEAKKVKVGA